MKIDLVHKIVAECLTLEIVASFEPTSEGAMYACYLLINGQKFSTTDYQYSSKFDFILPPVWATIGVVAFIRRADGEKIIERFDLGFSIKGAGLAGRYDVIILGRYETQVRLGFRARANSKAVQIRLPMAWKNADRNIMFALHAWRFIPPIWNKFILSQNYDYFDEGLKYIRDWYFFQKKASGVPFIWYDMAVGLRAIHLGFVWDVLRLSKRSLSAPDLTMLKMTTRTHLRRLADPASIGVANHAMWQMIGLKTLAIASGMGLPEEVTYADSVMARLLEAQFDSNGINTEDSPFYHGYNLSILRSIDRRLFSNLAGIIDRIISKGDSVIGWLTSPDGEYYRIGDTEGAPTSRIDPDSPDFHVTINNSKYGIKDYGASGYQVINSSTSSSGDGFSFVFHCPIGRVHGHADQLSFILYYKGCELFSDAGKYSYDLGEERSYFLSDTAHNTLGLAEVSIMPERVFDAAKKLSPVTVRGDVVLLTGEIDIRDTFSHERQIKIVPGQSIDIIDIVSNKTDREIEVRFLFGPDVNLVEKDGVVRMSNSSVLLGMLEVDCGATILVHSKEIEPKAWVSRRYREKNPVDSLCIRYPSDTRTIYTRISLL